jgi:GT2 family glycosyltransferase
MLYDCIKSIYDSKISFDYEIIVVDNASADDSVVKTKEAFPSVKYIENTGNLGFAKANNQGINLSKAKYVLIQNPDTIVIDSAIDNLVEYAEKNKDVGILGAKLLNSDGSLQYSIKRFPSVISQFFEALFLHKMISKLSAYLGEVIYDNNAYTRTKNVDWITGAIMLVREEAIESVGSFDESFFLYAEEVDWCYRMKKAGWQVIYYPKASFIHHMGKTKASELLYTQHIRARRQFGRKHFCKGKALLFDLASLTFLVVRAALYFIISTIKHTEDSEYMRILYSEVSKKLFLAIVSDLGLPGVRKVSL